MKKFLIGLLIFIVLLGAAALYLNTYLENQLRDIIQTKLPSSLAIEYEELDIDSWQGNASLKNANLENANLEDASLKWANLEGANLKNANLKNANLIQTIV